MIDKTIRSLLLGAIIASPLILNPLQAQTAVYTHPGIVTSQSGEWLGSDHLLNISNKIQVVVEILKPADTKISLTVEQLKARIEEAFKKAGIAPEESANSETPGIPFFNLLIVLYPIEKGYVGLVDGRLMESVDPLRVKLEKGTLFQAITWEKKTLVVAPTDDFKDSIDKSVDEVVKTFLERFDYYEKLKAKLEKREEVERLK